MNTYDSILTRCPLFDGIEPAAFPALLSCLEARVTRAMRNAVILREGEPATHLGIVLTGAVQIVRDDYYGNRSIVARVEPPELFGESFACAGVAALPVSAVAAEDCTLLMIDSRRVSTSCTSACAFHSRVIYNLLHVVAAKNLLFHQKLEILSQRTTRDKLMTYLLAQAKAHGSSHFTIPYDRQALADYLGVDRSAMSTELGKLRREGILDCHRSEFRLLAQPSDGAGGPAAR